MLQPANRFASRIRAVLVGLMIAFMMINAYFVTIGIPKWLLNETLFRLSSGNVAIEAASMKCILLHAVSGRDIQLYSRGMPGPPFLSAERITAYVDPLASVKRSRILTGLHVENAVLTPSMIRVSRRDSGREPSLLNLNFSASNCTIGALKIASLNARVRRTEARLWLEDIRIQVANEEGKEPLSIEGNLMRPNGSGSFSGSLRAVGSPHALIPALEHLGMRFTPAFINRFEFAAVPPLVEFDIKRSPGPSAAWDIRGRILLEQTAYQGVNTRITSANYRLQITTNSLQVTVDPLHAIRKNNLFSGGLTYSGGEDTNRLVYSVDSTVDARSFIKMTGVFTNGLSSNYDFGPPYSVLASGTNDWNVPSASMVTADVRCGRFYAHDINLEDVSFRLQQTAQARHIRDFESHVFGGLIAGQYSLFYPPEDSAPASFQLEGNWRGIDFSRLLSRLSKTENQDSSGICRGEIILLGVSGRGQSKTYTGRGTLRVSDGEVLMLKIFGGLTDHLAKALPGIGSVVSQTDAKIDYHIANGFVHIESFHIEGDLLSLRGMGRYEMGGELDVEVELTLFKSHTVVSKIVRLPTWVFSKLFKFKLSGTLDQPYWYPVNFSSDLWERIGLGSAKEEDVRGN